MRWTFMPDHPRRRRPHEILGATEYARLDNATLYRKGGHRETWHQIKQIATAWTSVGPRKNWTCWTISELNPVCHDSTAALIVACSFCVQSAILSVLIRSPYSRGLTTEVTATPARTKTRTGMALAVPAAPTSGASKTATAAAATTSDDC